MRPLPPAPSGLVVVLLAAACNGRFSAAGPVTVPVDHSRPPVPPPPSIVDGAASFDGIGSVTPLVDGFTLAWTPLAKDGAPDPDFAYSIWFTTDGRTPDFTRAADFTTAPGAASTTLTALAAGTLLRVGVRAIDVVDPGVTPDTNEVVLGGEVLPLLYIDGSVAASGDGTAPDRAFKTIAEAIGAGFGIGGANLLIAEGAYEEELLALGHLHFFGGWPAGFAGARDRALHPTTIAPALDAAVALRVTKSTAPTFVDALEMDGGKGVVNGIDVRDADLELSNSSIFRTRREGVTYSSRFHFARFATHRVDIADCGAEGMQLSGVFDAHFTSSTFVRNGHEGAQFKSLNVFAGGQARLRVRRCTFSRNVEDGLDTIVDEVDPANPGSSAGGVVEVVVEESLAEDNGQTGFKLDVDFDATDGIDARFFARADASRRNAQYGFHLDGDAPATYLLAGNLTSANRWSGVLASSDGGRALYQITNHWEQGAGTFGVEVAGPGDVLLDHVVIAGTAQAAISGNGATRLVDGALFLAPAPLATTVEYSWSDAPLPGLGNRGGANDLGNAPDAAFHLAVAGTTKSFRIPAGSTLAAGDVVEFDDDGTARTIVAVAAAVAQFEPAAAAPLAAGTFVARFASGDVVENPTLVPGSPWLDAGDPLVRDADGSTTDLGALGGLLPTYRSVFSALLPFAVAALDPASGPTTGPIDHVTIRCTRPIDPASVDAASFAVTLDGAPVAGTFTVAADTATFTPNVPLLTGRCQVALAATLRADDASPLLEPLRFTVDLP